MMSTSRSLAVLGLLCLWLPALSGCAVDGNRPPVAEASAAQGAAEASAPGAPAGGGAAATAPTLDESAGKLLSASLPREPIAESTGASAGEQKTSPGSGPGFTFVYSVNNSGYVDVCGCKHKEVKQGSLTRRATFLKSLRATGRDLLLLDGGSTLFHIASRLETAERADAIRKAELIVEAYNRMGYRAMAVGAFELAGGMDTLQALREKADFDFLSANLVDRTTGELYFQPHAVYDVGGVKVGVIGLTIHTLSRRAYLDKVAPNAVLSDPVEAARKSFEALRPKTDLIIALSHLREETSFEVAEKVRGIEFLVDPFIQYGSHRTWIDEEAWVGFRGDSVLLRADGQGARLGIIDVELHHPRAIFYSGDLRDELARKSEAGEATDAEKKELAGLEGKNLFRFTRISLDPHNLTDPEIDLLVSEWKKNIDPATVRQLEEDLPLRDRYSTHDKCQPCHEKQHEFWKSTAHSHAYASLEKTGDHHRYDCVGCHSLGYGQAFLDTSKIGPYADVQCESCHGSKPEHLVDAEAHRYGRVSRKTCLNCHNKEQLRKEFDFFRSRRMVACPKG